MYIHAYIYIYYRVYTRTCISYAHNKQECIHLSSFVYVNMRIIRPDSQSLCSGGEADHLHLHWATWVFGVWKWGLSSNLDVGRVASFSFSGSVPLDLLEGFGRGVCNVAFLLGETHWGLESKWLGVPRELQTFWSWRAAQHTCGALNFWAIWHNRQRCKLLSCCRTKICTVQ